MLRCLLMFLVFVTNACSLHFTNGAAGPKPDKPSVFVPTALDFTSSGGHAARVTAAVRRALSQDPRVILTSRETARWGLDIRITEGQRRVTKTEECSPGERVVGSGAYPCVDGSVHQPSVSSIQEEIRLSVEVIAIDLRSGQTAFARRLLAEDVAAKYPVVADAETTEGTTMLRGLANSPELHSLRYMENADTAVETLGRTIASAVLAEVKKLK